MCPEPRASIPGSTARARSVPRAVGVTRLGTVPGLARLVDEGTRILRQRTGRLS